MERLDLLKAGHYEIHGETIAKFEFFQNGFNPYSRYLDVDKVDLILRKKEKNRIKYIEVQVKFGTLFTKKTEWYQNRFNCHSWKFFNPNEFKNTNPDLFIAYVLSLPNEYKGDLFVFPVKVFSNLISKSVQSKTKKGDKAKFMLANDKESNKWFLLTQSTFANNKLSNGIDVTKYRRNFNFNLKKA